MKQFRFWHRIILTCGSLFLILTGLVLLMPAVLPMLPVLPVPADTGAGIARSPFSCGRSPAGPWGRGFSGAGWRLR